MTSRSLLVGLLLATCSLVALASDPGSLQDFCVADNSSKVLVNGFVCKDPKMVKAEDFLFKGLDKMGNTTNAVGSNVTAVNVNQLPGLNTFGISMVRIDYAPWGQNAPHTHPRATEILVVIEGSLLVGFVTSNTDNKLFTKRLEKGDVFVFPEGLIHFQQNVGNGFAVAIAGLSSQNPGVITIANAVFGSNPDISDDILAKAFQVDKKVIDEIQSVVLAEASKNEAQKELEKRTAKPVVSEPVTVQDTRSPPSEKQDSNKEVSKESETQKETDVFEVPVEIASLEPKAEAAQSCDQEEAEKKQVKVLPEKTKFDEAIVVKNEEISLLKTQIEEKEKELKAFSQENKGLKLQLSEANDVISCAKAKEETNELKVDLY
ncbi:putative germin-like protein 2-1 [Tanacetum coccineum]